MSEIIEVGHETAPNAGLLDRIKLLLASGGTIVYPTRTLYGLGASISSINGILKVLNIKERPNGPVTVMLNRGQLTDFADIPVKAMELIESGLPLTFVLPAKPNVSSLLTEKDGSLAVRVSDTTLMESVIDKTGPMTSTSANISGGKNPTNIDIARRELGDLPDLYIDAGDTPERTGSTIVDLTGKTEAKILRQGAVSEAKVREIYG